MYPRLTSNSQSSRIILLCGGITGVHHAWHKVAPDVLPHVSEYMMAVACILHNENNNQGTFFNNSIHDSIKFSFVRHRGKSLSKVSLMSSFRT
jgi:hypothetical protein